MRLIILGLLVIVLYFGWGWFKREYEQKGRGFLVKFLLVAVACLLLLLAAAGRVHWVGAALASLLASLRFALPILARSLPFLMRFVEARAEKERSNHTPVATEQSMDEPRALATLGLKKPYSKNEVIAAHKRIMQSLHPDKGGSDLLAAQVNEAKTLLLDTLNKN